MTLKCRLRIFLAATFLCLFIILVFFNDLPCWIFGFLLPSTPAPGNQGTIANTTLGFQKVFVINAPWRTDRKDAMSLMTASHDISVDWIDGVNATNMQESAYPPGKHRFISEGVRGCWRAHMNTLQEIIAQNLSTALIFEDDIDWDTRLRPQLVNLAHASRNLPNLIANAYQTPHSSVPTSEDQTPDPIELAKRSTLPFPLLSSTSHSKEAPYGRDWDVLWLGHCGASLPPTSITHPTRISLPNDATVPSAKHLRFRAGSVQDSFATVYPPHTRLYHRTANSTLCTHAYAVTQRGARKLLYQFGVREFSQGYDFALGDYCGGDLHRHTGETEGERPMCLTVQPPLFSQFWGESGESDIVSTGREGRMVGSRYIRWSARAGVERLGSGLGLDGSEDQWPDEEVTS